MAITQLAFVESWKATLSVSWVSKKENLVVTLKRILQALYCCLRILQCTIISIKEKRLEIISIDLVKKKLVIYSTLEEKKTSASEYGKPMCMQIN